MKPIGLLKVVPVAAIALSIYSTGAVAGGTNRDGNTAATPGPKATTTTTPADPAANRQDMRRGTTNTQNMDTPSSAGEVGGSGSSGGSGSMDDNSGNSSDSKWERYNQGKSSARPGEGSAPENTDSGYDLSTGNTSGSSVGTQDSTR